MVPSPLPPHYMSTHPPIGSSFYTFQSTFGCGKICVRCNGLIRMEPAPDSIVRRLAACLPCCNIFPLVKGGGGDCAKMKMKKIRKILKELSCKSSSSSTCECGLPPWSFTGKLSNNINPTMVGHIKSEAEERG